MERFVCVMTYVDSMEAELAKNYLEGQGIQAMITADEVDGSQPEISPSGGIRLVVLEDDLERARELLEGSAREDGMAEADEAEVEAFARDSEEAEKEFAAIKEVQLEQKAESARANAILGGFVLAAGIAGFVFIPNRSMAVRVGIACLIFAVIQYFVWRDCKKAGEQLESIRGKEISSRHDEE